MSAARQRGRPNPLPRTGACACWAGSVRGEWAIIEWVSWYNRSRLHGEIGDVPPTEYAANWYRQNRPAVMAGTQ